LFADTGGEMVSVALGWLAGVGFRLGCVAER
jgi:hypothetical protein